MEKKLNTRVLLIAGVLLLSMLVPFVAFAADTPVLLVWDSSDFKDELAREIHSAAEDAGLVVAAEGSTKLLKDINTADYSGIVIINTGMAGRMKSKVRKFMEGNSDLPPTVVVTTYGNGSKSRDPEYSRPAVDAITTASLNETREINTLARLVVEKLLD